MKKGWIIVLLLLVLLTFIQQSVVFSQKTNKTVLLAQYNDTGDCANDEKRSWGWSLLDSDVYSDNQTNINKCIGDTNNSHKWCCVCFEDTFPSICSQLFTALTATPIPTSTPTSTPIPTPLPVDCKWSFWSTCSAPCGTGTQTRSIVTPASNGGAVCMGPSSQSCYIIEHCPVDCEWGTWSACSKDCGEGIQTRSIKIMAAYGGKPCTGAGQTSCIVKSCSALGTGGLTTGTMGDSIQISFSTLMPIVTPTPKNTLRPTYTPIPTQKYTPTSTPLPVPTGFDNGFTPTSTPHPVIYPTALPAPTNIPLPTTPPIPRSLIAGKATTDKKITYTVDPSSVAGITVSPFTAPVERPFLSQEQLSLVQSEPPRGGILITLEQKVGNAFTTHQDELTVKRGNQFFTITNQQTDIQPQKVVSKQSGTNSTSSSPAPLLEINANNVVAKSSMGLSVDPLSGILTVETPTGPQKVSIMPDEALGIVLELKALNGKGQVKPSILLVSEKGALIYRISGERVEKFLGLLPFPIQKQILISADTGSIVKVELSLLSQILSFFTF